MDQKSSRNRGLRKFVSYSKQEMTTGWTMLATRQTERSKIIEEILEGQIYRIWEWGQI